MAQRKRKGDGRCHNDQNKRSANAQQPVNFGGHVECAIKCRDARTGEALADTPVGGEGITYFRKPCAKQAEGNQQSGENRRRN